MNMKENMTEYIAKHNEKKNRNLKYDFMPELLEIIEKPAHGGTKVIIWTVFAVLFAAVLWAGFSKVDIVVTAQGIVMPTNSVEVVQARESGYISQVCVANGQSVKQGDVLVKADTEALTINLNAIEEQMELLKAENALYESILAGKSVADMDLKGYEESIRNNMDYIISEEKLYQQSLTGLSEESLQNMKERHRLELLGKVIDNDSTMIQLEAQLAQAEKSISNQVITAQSDGIVANMPAELSGSAVTQGSRLMEIVPKESKMEVLAYVSNQDIADIEKGMDVGVKLSAYPYSDYGMLKGQVSYISSNTISEGDIVNMYVVKVKLHDVDEDIELMSGLTGSVDIKTGKRSVLNYFLEPLTEALQESIKEK